MGLYLRGKSYYYNFYYEGKRYNEKIGQVSESVANEKLTIKKSEVIRGEWKPKAVKTSFDKFKDEYLKHSEGNKREKTFIRDGSSIKKLSTFFSGKMLSEVNPFLIEKYKLERKGKGAKPATINRELACLRNLLNMAVLWNKTPKFDWAFGKKRDVKFLREPEPRDRILSPEEEAKLFEVIKSENKIRHLEPIIIIALNTGLRKQNILKLRWSEVDFKTRYINIGMTKNGKGVKIPMNETVRETLENARKVSDGEYVFSRNGKPYDDVKRGLGSALEKTKIENFHFHDFRHSFGTRLAMMGYDLKTIMELMGISEPKVAMRYLNPTQQHKRRAVESLDGVTTKLTTLGVDKDNRKVVNIGNR